MNYTGAENGLEALRILKQRKTKYDIIIIDYRMPYMNGIDTIKQFRKEELFETDNQPIMLLHSSSDDAYIYESAKELGVRFTLTKPVKANELYFFLQNVDELREMSNSSSKELREGFFTHTIENEQQRKILIAEDTSMNMLLLSRMLNSIIPNVRLYTAKNGEEALEVLKSVIPDLIFMDIQMPVLDGLETTKAIRKSENPRIKDIPIVALTAGVSKVERDDCFNAGMNGFLSKPVNKDTLHSVLIDYFLNNDQNEKKHPVTEPAIDMENQNQHFQKDELLKKIGYEETIFDKLIELSLKELPDYLNTLVAAAKRHDTEEVKSIAHKIKGSALNMEFILLGNIAKEIETMCEDDDKLPSLIESILLEWQEVNVLI